MTPVEAESVQELSELLRQAPQGAWAPQGLGGHGAALPPSPQPLPTLSLRGLRALRSHRADELLVVAEAGMSLAELQAELGQRGQWLPAWDERPESSLGGLLASDRTGPWRCGHGRLADRVLWAQALLADGSVVESGAQVVKSVAGYDWARLLVGSEGAFGIWAAVALKVAPLPKARQAWAIAHDELPALMAHAEAAWGLGATAVELRRDGAGPWRLMWVLEGHPADLKAQAASLSAAWRLGPPAEATEVGAGWAGPQGDWEGELRWQSPPLACPDAAWWAALAGASGLAASPTWGGWRARFASPAKALAALGALAQHGQPWSWRLRPGLPEAKEAAWRATLGPLWWGPASATWPLVARLKAEHDPQDRWQRGRLAQAVGNPT